MSQIRKATIHFTPAAGGGLMSVEGVRDIQYEQGWTHVILQTDGLRFPSEHVKYIREYLEVSPEPEPTHDVREEGGPGEDPHAVERIGW